MRQENLDNALEDLFDTLYRKERKGVEYRYTRWSRSMNTRWSNITSNNNDNNGFIIVRVFDNYPAPKSFDVIGHNAKIVELVKNFVQDWMGGV